ncbi:TonB-dependent receptor [Marilutibacter maris]|uniref:Secretin/TonB short N-terminal domain-containing protein n=1 Tax=Marilutibacter maris TaxID=1605891 RepID=A0A2U9T788_9GAMM|nr:TonB-dependent receptor [Lysobacter maris]AWV06834.1 hypothetical protein C9I47_1117 [Lysobacter maris]
MSLRTDGAWAVEPSAAESGTSTEQLQLDLPGGTLDGALKALALRSGIQILYAPGQVESRRARALNGRMTLEHALRYLLEGSELRAERVNADTFVLKTTVAPKPEQAVPPPPSMPRQRAVDMDRVEVTGSRIPRIDIDAVTPSPMTLITREDIETSGFQTLFELLRFQPGMIGHHPVAVAAEGGPNFQQPFNVAATTSLNALGPRATLFLVDGRRVANYGLTSAELGGLTDLDAIPLSLVDRVEILRGGASAIYGADAIAGVVNIILRKRQKGGEALIRYGRSERGDAGERRLSLSHGFDTPRGGSGMLAADWFDREALPGDARDWHTRDRSRDGLPDGRTWLAHYYRFLDLDDVVEPVALECGNAPAEVIDANCRFDQARYTDLQPASRRLWLYGHLSEPLWEGTTLELDARYGEAQQELRYPPFSASVELPAGHPDRYPDFLPMGFFLGRPEVRLNYAFFELGPVTSRTDNRTFDFGAALKGWRGDWAWDVSASHHANRVVSSIDGQVSLEEFLSPDSLGRYRFDGTPNDPERLAAISPTFTLRGEATLQQLSAGLEGPVFKLPGGAARLAVGGEFLRNGLVHEPDARLLKDDLALGTPKTARNSHRNSAALYAELGLPLLDNLQADVALRYDDPQDYGSRVSPKLGLKWSPHESFTFRATAATGYRVPSLFELRRPNVIPQSKLVPASDALRPCLEEVVIDPSVLQRLAQFRLAPSYCRVELGAFENPNLVPETSRSHTLGMVWAPSPDFSLSFDHFRIRRDNEIAQGNVLDSPEAFPESVRRDKGGRLVGIDSYYQNIGRSDIRGWEAEMRWHVDAGDAGRLSLTAAVHQLSRVKRQLGEGAPVYDHAGYGAPTTNLLGSVQWARGNWTHTLALRARGPYQVGSPVTGCPGYNRGRCRTPGRGVLDLDIAYNGIPGWRLGLNVRDLADRDPVNYDIERDGYDIAYDDPRGRYLLLSARYRF